MEKKWVSLKIMMTAEMAPNAKIVVYFVKRNAEIIVDSISFNVEGIFANDVSFLVFVVVSKTSLS